MTTRTIGDLEVAPIALGGFPFGFRTAEHDESSISTIHAAIDAGITLIDSALAYTSMQEPAHADRIIAEAVRTHPDGERVVIASKGGHFRASEHEWPKDARPSSVRAHCQQTLAAMERDVIDLYFLHWPDPEVPFDEQVGGLAALRDEGLIRNVGLSNVTTEQIEVARRVVPIAAVQNQLSPHDRSDLPVVEHCAAEGIAYLAYSPLGGGSHARAVDDELPAFAAVAAEHGVSTQQVVLAWHLTRSPVSLAIVGASRPASVRDGAGALDLRLSPEDLTRLDA